MVFYLLGGCTYSADWVTSSLMTTVAVRAKHKAQVTDLVRQSRQA
jgi:hypothetical protein